MYCIKCGCKFNTGDKKCSECGAEITGIEYSGGFWGLVGEDEKRMSIAQLDEPMEPKKENIEQVQKEKPKVVKKAVDEEKLNEELLTTIKKDSHIKRKYKKKIQLLSGILIILVLVCLIQTVRGFLLSKKYKNTQTEYETLNQEYQDLYTTNTALSTQYEELTEQYEKLTEQYEEFQKQTDTNIDSETSDGNDEVFNEELDQFDETTENFSDDNI